MEGQRCGDVLDPQEISGPDEDGVHLEPTYCLTDRVAGMEKRVAGVPRWEVDCMGADRPEISLLTLTQRETEKMKLLRWETCRTAVMITFQTWT